MCLFASHFIKSVARFIVVFRIPLHRCFDGLLEVCKLEIGQQFTQLCIGCSLLVLSIRFAGITDEFALKRIRLNPLYSDNTHLAYLKVKCFGYGFGYLKDCDLRRLVHTEHNGLHAIIVSEHPNHELGQIERVDELAQRLAASVHRENLLALGYLGLFGSQFVHTIYHARYDVTNLGLVIVVWAEDVARYHGRV